MKGLRSFSQCGLHCLLFAGVTRRSDGVHVADVGGALDGGLALAPGLQLVHQPPALLRLRQTLLGDRTKEAQNVVRLAPDPQEGICQFRKCHSVQQRNGTDDGAVKDLFKKGLLEVQRSPFLE